MHIDWWTLALQTVNVLVLIWILGRFFFRPVADIVAKRREQANALLAAAAAARREAADARADAENARAEIDAERGRLIAEARKSAESERTDLLAQSSEQIAKLRSEAEATIERQRIAAEQAIIARASELSVEIARRLLGRLQSAIPSTTFVDGLCKELSGLSPEEKQRLASAAGDPIKVVTATPLSEDDAERVRRVLQPAFGVQPLFEFQTDPAVIAGIELHSRNTIIRNSWRADLERIREELSRDEHPRGS